MAPAGDDIFQQALASFQSGRLNDAERLFKKGLRQQPKHVAALNLLSVVLTRLERYAEAEPYLKSALKLNSKSDVTFYNYGLVLKALQRPTEALERFNQALSINATVAETWNNRGTIFNDLKRYDEAIADFNKAIALQPNYSEAYCNKGKSLAELKRHNEALAAFEKALALNPGFAEAWLGGGNVLSDLKRHDEALAAYDKSLSIKPGLADSWFGRGNVLGNLKRHDEAFAAYGKALAIKPDLAEAWLGRGNVFGDLKRHDEAFAAYDKALSLKPDLAEAWSGRGNVYGDLRRYDEAFAAYDKALSIKPDLAEAWFGRGNVFYNLKRHDEAFAAYDKALAIKPDLAEAWLGRGNILCILNRYDEAVAAYDKALAIKPDLAEAWLGRGNVGCNLKRRDEALAAYDKALSINPGLAEAWFGRGNVFGDLKRYGEAYAAYDKALTLTPDLIDVEGSRLHVKMHLCDWSNYDAECAHLISAVRDGKLNTQPFMFLTIPSLPEDQLHLARQWAANRFPFSEKPIWRGERYNHDRIRVAYLSADFREHPVSFLMAGMFECHDKSRFEVTAISLGPDDNSEMRQRLKASFEYFVDARTYSDDRIANLIRSSEVDVLVDLMGFTGDAQPGISARRAAPIQVNYLGYAGTMGAPYIDYILADKFVIPEAKRGCYSEKVVYLPDSFMANDSKRKISRHLPSRTECGLPETGFVFCSFNNSYKITPQSFDIWMRILCRNENSVLWLSGTNEIVIRHLRHEATNRGVDPDRIVFAQRVSRNEDHLARHRLADLFLDTLPFNAHTTASDALWAGLPVLTCLGETYAGRVAASLLNAIGLPELITATPEAYEQLAIDLATQPEKLALIKHKLAENRLTTPLFDTKLFTKHIEAAYSAMYERHQAGLAPDHIVIRN